MIEKRKLHRAKGGGHRGEGNDQRGITGYIGEYQEARRRQSTCEANLYRWVIAILPELPDEQGPELFPVVSPVFQMVLQKLFHILRVEKSLPSNPFVRKHLHEEFF